MFFQRHALVIMMHISRMAGAAFAAEICPTITAEQLRCQQIIILRFMTGRCFLVLFQLFLYPVKQLLRNDHRNPVMNHNIPESIFPDVPPISEHQLDIVEVHRFAHRISHTVFFQPVAQFLHGRAIRIALIGFKNEGCLDWINLQMMLLINHITQWCRPAIVLALQSVFRQASGYLFRKISRVILRHAFQNGFKQYALRFV